MKRTWYGSMSMEQAEKLLETFAYLTEDGWKFPNWLVHLINQIKLRDSGH